MLGALLLELFDGSWAPVGGVTLRAYGRRWLDRREREGVRDIANERRRWRAHVEQAPFADEHLSAISPRTIHDWLEGLRFSPIRYPYDHPRNGKRRSLKTIREIRSLLRLCFQDAFEIDTLVGSNPVPRVKRRRRKQERPQQAWTFLELHEQEALLQCEKIPASERQLIAIAMYTGMRPSEMAHLRLEDVHLEAESPHVVVQYGGQGGGPKNEKVREVPLFGEALAAMARWLEALSTFAPHNPNGLAFPRANGTMRPLDNKGPFMTKWHAYCRLAGIERRVRFYDLKHTCASMLVQGAWGRTWTLPEVAELLGHSNSHVTEMYAHVGDTALKKAARATPGAVTAKVTRRSRRRPRTTGCATQPRGINTVGPGGLEPPTYGLKARSSTN